jgi:RNA polymerase sigma factor (sigma-70 family)
MMNEDMELVREYAARQSEPAFEMLATRYINLVYATAVRRVGDPHLAEEITQAVFILLARKANTLGPKTILPSWLHRTTGFAATDALKSQRRRRQREQEAHMQTLLNEPAGDEWSRIVPLLDAAVDRLGEKDRRAIVLRFFQQKSLNEVAVATGVSEEAAKKRVHRAVEKLRKIFQKHGVNSTAAIIMGGISNSTTQAAPVTLAKTVTAIVMAKGAAVPASTLLIIKGTLKQMAWAKWRFTAGTGAAILLAGTIAVATMPQADDSNLDDNNDRYQIDGDLTYGSADTGMTRNFTLTVNGSNWMIHLTHPKPDPEAHINWAAFGLPERKPVQFDYKQIYEEEVGLNGSVYCYCYYGKLPAGAINNGSANIQYGDTPIDDATFANYAWVGLASGYYFSTNINNEVTPINHSTSYPRYDRIMARWQLNETAPFLPKSVDYYNGALQAVEGRRIPNMPFAVMRPSADGSISAEVRVLQTKTVNGKTFPTVYTYEQFRTKSAGVPSSNNLERLFLVSVHVHAIHLHAVPDVLPPKPQGDTTVIDERYIMDRQQKPVPFQVEPGSVVPNGMYILHGGRLPEEPDVKMIMKFEKEGLSRSRQ